MKTKDKIERLALTGLKNGQKGEIASIYTEDHDKLKKLMAMGVLPGIKISLVQKFPSYVFQIGHSQFAIDKEIAECVFIWAQSEGRDIFRQAQDK
jgi:DtxR family Mn-dependent transcriptional regulator